MARTNVQKAYGSNRCQVETGTDYAGNPRVCNKSKKAHGPSVKHPITDHLYGGEDGTNWTKVYPVCGSCREAIPHGEQYKLWVPRYKPRMVRHMTCPTPPRSAFTNSEILSMAWDLADGSWDVMEDKDSFTSQVEDVANGIEEIVDVIQDKLDNIESGFGHTELPVYEELDERREMYEEWQREVEELDADEFEEEGDACTKCGLSEDDGDHMDEDDWHDFDPEDEFDSEGAHEAFMEALGACPE